MLSSSSLPSVFWRKHRRPLVECRINGFEFVVGSGAKRTLIVRDAQHEYVFKEEPAR